MFRHDRWVEHLANSGTKSGANNIVLLNELLEEFARHGTVKTSARD